MAAILLAGCSSYSTMTAVYILELSYANSTLSNPGSVQKTMYDTLNELKGRAQLKSASVTLGCVCVSGEFCGSAVQIQMVSRNKSVRRTTR